MVKYHVNPNTGEPGVCKAVIQCRFNLKDIDHYPTKEIARQQYEKQMEKKELFNVFESYGNHVCPTHVSCTRPECVDLIHDTVLTMIDESDLESHVKTAVRELIAFGFKNYGAPIVGRSRATFISEEENKVFKVPLNKIGVESNNVEVNVNGVTSDGVPVAKAWFDDPEHIVMTMEKVTPINNPRETLENVPVWVYSVDNAQVGLTNDGKLVAFDL